MCVPLLAIVGNPTLWAFWQKLYSRCHPCLVVDPGFPRPANVSRKLLKNEKIERIGAQEIPPPLYPPMLLVSLRDNSVLDPTYPVMTQIRDSYYLQFLQTCDMYMWPPGTYYFYASFNFPVLFCCHVAKQYLNWIFSRQIAKILQCKIV